MTSKSMSFSRNIWWNLAYPLTVNRVRLSAALTVICWHLRLGHRLGAFQIHTIRWRHSRLAPLTVTVTVSVTFRNVSIISSRQNLYTPRQLNCKMYAFDYGMVLGEMSSKSSEGMHIRDQVITDSYTVALYRRQMCYRLVWQLMT